MVNQVCVMYLSTPSKIFEPSLIFTCTNGQQLLRNLLIYSLCWRRTVSLNKFYFFRGAVAEYRPCQNMSLLCR